MANRRLHRDRGNRAAPCMTLLLALGGGSAAAEDVATDALLDAFRHGTPDFSLRWRYERVEDDLAAGGVPLKDADASTVRATLGYRTGVFRDFSAYLQLEAIGAVGADDYYDGSGTGNARFATVVDPEGAEINEGYLEWSPLTELRLRGGRQVVTYRKAPFHRFLGTVLWRQNWQTHDAVTARYAPADDIELNYAYTWNVNRIFGEDAPEPLSDFDSDSHFVNGRFRRYGWLELEAYAYLLDFDNAPRFSSNTFGMRAHGTRALDERWALVYAGEYAHQYDAAGNPADYDAEYVLLEGGFSVKPAALVKSLKLTLSYERLGGDGTPGGAFVTALGTNHAFQGWADRFLVTPDAGIEDTFVTAVLALPFAGTLVVAYHMLEADEGGFDYGDELDVMLTRRLFEHYELGAKASFYDADPSPRNAAGGPSADVTKIWFWGEVSF